VGLWRRSRRARNAVGWRDLLTKGDEKITLPWLGENVLRASSRHWSIVGKRPPEHGWYTFKLEGRTVRFAGKADAQPELLVDVMRGYLVGDRVVADDARCDPDPKRIVEFSEPVHLLEESLDRFARVRAGRIYKDGPLVYYGMEMPLGPEDAVMQVFLDQKTSVSDVKGVSPALDAAFRMELWQRIEAERRRVELERIRKEEEEQRLKEERRQALVKKLGDGEGRREMAKVDFPRAARAALQVAGAEFLDAKSVRRNEWAVKYRLDGARYECICDEKLGIIDSGICLVDHATGEKGDTYFTLESLPAVLRQANRERRLVVYRHV
jgi:hypothetical protein